MLNKNQNFLEEIIKIKKEELARKTRKTQKIGVSENQNYRNSNKLRFHKLFKRDAKRICLIAELKFASPTHPKLGSQDDLLLRAKEYKKAGADAISIITEKHLFNGDVSFVTQIKKNVSIPVLQKDFVIDPQQIYEAKKIGSDALLLIARLVDKKTLIRFVNMCLSLGIEPVVEINNEADLKKAIETNTRIIAVNARDLENFTIDVAEACMLIKKIPEGFITLGFSGIKSDKEVIQYKKSGASGILIGTSLMQAKNITRYINDLPI